MPSFPVERVLVIGSGIAGLAVTLALRQAGLCATAYEQAPALREVGAGISLWPNATRALRRLELLTRVEAQAGVIRAASVKDPSGRTLLRARVSGYHAPALCVHRADLLNAFRTALPHDAVQLQKTFVGLTENGRRVHAHFADGSDVEGDLLIGADGIRSAVRTNLFCDASPVYRGHTVWRGIGPLPSSFARGEIFEVWGDGLRFGLFDAGGGRAYWYALHNRPEGEGDAGSEAQKAELLQLLGDWQALALEAIEATPAEAILRNDVYDRPSRWPWHKGRAVLIGDAAHPITPDLGQGGAMAFEDALALVQYLAGAHTVEAALIAFERERFRRTAWIRRQSLWAGRIGQLGGLAGQMRNIAAQVYPSRLFEQGFTWPFHYAV